MVHSVSGWTRGVQVKLWDPLRTRAIIPERLRGVFMTKRYTNPRLPLPLVIVLLFDIQTNSHTLRDAESLLFLWDSHSDCGTKKPDHDSHYDSRMCT